MTTIELPVRQIVVYKHGVAFFLRKGPLAAGESARLDFNAEEMDDVLKSLMINEEGEGKVTCLRYDSSIPLNRKLAEFPIDIADAQPLTAILDQLRGAQIEIPAGGETLTGVILGARVVPASEGHPEQQTVSLLLESGALQTLELTTASTIRFSDPKIQVQLRDYLSALAGARSKNKRSLFIDSTGAQSREVAASYTIPAPVWKSSYRLVLDESGAPMIEGWAIVDNTTGEDWTDISMSLVAGKPFSYITSLYEPKYVDRPTAVPRVRPPAPAGRGNIVEMLSASAPSSVEPDTFARELGDVFEYAIRSPVTVKKNQSCMLPFLQERISGRKLLICSFLVLDNPDLAVELTNSTGKTLDGGPVIVFDAGAYAGEAQVDTFKAGDKRLILYGKDLGTHISYREEHKRKHERPVQFSKGRLTVQILTERVQIFTIRNIDPRSKTLVIDSPLWTRAHMLSPQPTETTATGYRFELELEPSSTREFRLEFEQYHDNVLVLQNARLNDLAQHLADKNLSDMAHQGIQKVFDFRNQLLSLEHQQKALEAQILAVADDQERTRKNIASLSVLVGQQKQVDTYAQKLAVLEEHLSVLRVQETGTQKERVVIQANLDAFLEKLEF